MNHKSLTSWLPLVLFTLIMVASLRPIVLGGVPRGLLGPGRWKAGISYHLRRQRAGGAQLR